MRGSTTNSRRRGGAALAALACALVPAAARPAAFSSVEPGEVRAGSFYDGATLHVRGTVDAGSQVAIRVTGPVEHHTFNRRGRIGGLFWGGIEHVTFEHAPSLYAVSTSAALEALAPPALRSSLRLGYETLEPTMSVRGTTADPRELVQHLVRLKESEGLYRVAPGAVHLGDADGGRRVFDVALRVPAAAAPGPLEVAVFELAGGAVLRQDATTVELRRVGMPAVLFQLAHGHSALMGLLAVLVLLAAGVGVDLLGSSSSALHPHPAVVVVGGLARGVHDAVLAPRRGPRSLEGVERIHQKYRLFRTLLSLNHELLELLADLEEESSWTSFRHPRIRMGIRALFDGTADMVGVLNELTGDRYFDLANVVATLRGDVKKVLEKPPPREGARYTLALRELGSRTADLAGEKAVDLARVECDVGLAVPASFVVTVDAYRELLDAGGLASQLRTLLAPARLDDPKDLRRRCELAQEVVRDAAVPPSVADAIEAARRAAGFADGEGLAVRSCAAGEGGALSFAGQFDTLLDVPARGLVDAWKRVVASRYSPRAVFYRRAAGLAEVDTPMAVLVQRMVRARASGVLFTRPPDAPRGATMLVSAAPGLGPEVSAGTAAADRLVVSRAAPHRVLERQVELKAVRLVATGGGVSRVAVPPGEQGASCLGDADAARLAEAALAIERYFGEPQDVEWCLDAEGRLYVLQARALRAERPPSDAGADPWPATILARGGEPVWPGRAVGPVHVARTTEEEEETPQGALLVVPQLHPDCVRVLPRVCGIVAERGTVTGHAASLLREFRVPSLFGVAGALERLLPGRVASLDVARRCVLDGAAWPELVGRLPVAQRGHRAAGLPELLAGKLTKLGSSALVGTWTCRSLHDVIRFAHEMAIQAMFDVGDRLLDSEIGGVKTVDCAPPLYVHLVDLGGGVAPEAAQRDRVAPHEIASVPLRGLWRGLADANFHPERPEGPPPSGAALFPALALARSVDLGAPNYACITDSYLNLNTRGGIERDPLRARPRRQACHYAIVDAFLSENANENHLRMRLRGGGAAPAQRRLRAELAAEVLRRHRFTATVTGDLMNAWLRGVDRDAGATALASVGRLLRFLARLDEALSEPADVERWLEAFDEAEAASARAALADARGVPPAARRPKGA